jgi:hypothetical protein
MAEKIKTTRVREPGLYGYVLTLGNRTAEVFRTYPGHWAVFCYEAGKMWVLGFNPPDTDKASAMLRANAYLRRGELPYRAQGRTPVPYLKKMDGWPIRIT